MNAPKTFGTLAVTQAARSGALPTSLGIVERAVLMMIASFAGPENTVWPATDTIAAALNCARSTVHEAIHVLVREGLLVQMKRRRYQPTIYQLAIAEAQDSGCQNSAPKNSGIENSARRNEDSAKPTRRIPAGGHDLLIDQITDQTMGETPALSGDQDSASQNPRIEDRRSSDPPPLELTPPSSATRPKRPTKASTKATRCPPSEATREELAVWWEHWKLPPIDGPDAHEVHNWLDHHRANGNSFLDWAASWRTWKRKAEKWASERAPPKRPRPADHPAPSGWLPPGPQAPPPKLPKLDGPPPKSAREAQEMINGFVGNFGDPKAIGARR